MDKWDELKTWLKTEAEADDLIRSSHSWDIGYMRALSIVQNKMAELEWHGDYEQEEQKKSA